MTSLIRQFDWEKTPVGGPVGWPAPLKTLIATVLRANVPIILLWGPDGVMIYNDAYAAFAGGRHPSLLGCNVREGWPEVADFNDNVLKVVLAGGTLAYRDQHLVLERKGVPEDVWLNLDYSPILDENGAPGGVLSIVKETTERVRVEQRLRIAQEAGGIGTFEWYPETGRLDVSDEYRRIWGLGPDVPVTDKLLVGLLHPDDRAVAGPAKLAEANPLEYAEYRRIDPQTGAVRWIARRGEVVSSAGSGQRRFIGIAFDITARKLAEAAIQESEARWRGLFEQMQEGFFIGEVVRNADGIIDDFIFVELNPAFEDQTGVAAATAAGRRVREIIPGVPDDLIARYASVVETGEALQFEVHVPSLADRWFEARARKAGPDRFAVLFVDISARKLTEQAILESEARFRSLAQSMPNHVWTAGPDGRLDWFNDRVYAYSGSAPGMLDGTGWVAMLHADDVETTAGSWAEACRTGTPYEVEFRLRRHDGIYRWHIARAVPIRCPNGVLERWIGTNTDIEDQKTAEAALADLAATLEERVEARTAELLRTQDALRQSQKMESIGNLTGGVAHDFNNLLQVISGNMQLLSNDLAGNARAEQRLQNAMAGVARGSKLASQLLAFGRRQPLAPKVVNIGRLVRNMDDILRRALGEAIEVETIVAGGLWNTFIDPSNVENAILNLAINARDAMDGSGRLTIEAGNAFLDDKYAANYDDVTPGQYVILAVTDTGVGMTREVLDQVFEPFFTTKPEGKGTGLGLSMVYGFVKQSGGHINIYSEPGQGTTIKLYLPRSTQSEDRLVDIESGPITGGSETILIAEDDEAVRETVVALLSDLGYRVLKAKDAQSALTVIESGMAIDLLFTDVVMPGPMKSPELARQARERLPGISVLFTSGYTENSIVHSGRLDEGVELLSKPYTREALARKIRYLLSKADAAGNDDGAVVDQAEAPVQAEEPTAQSAAADAPADAGPKTILVCEDDWLIRASTVELLEDLGHTVIEAADAKSALAVLSERNIDILVTDVGLPDMSGIMLAERAWAIVPSLPVIYATGHSNHEGIQPGAGVQLVVKPYSGDTLAAAIAAVSKDS
ncbi:PAS domain S-box protein [Rhizobium sp. 32-5/1]|uniref:hybrid sensor histidine kinase/response regulator n=1 Tax=Rhizobium sp. 32-5/1 TaxID=3019602 RepID=UPI00240E0A10|nr:PAS domain S-box protein [Rhizobium sp. 32-5/1]WEZ84310.1 PAS domain S-box protein [Rhizobium sp. 32-5/1]